MTVRARRVAGALVFSSVLACGATTFSPAEQANACEAYVSAQLAHADRCRDSSEMRSSLPGKGDLVQVCNKRVGAENNGITPASMNACATALRGASCEQKEADVPDCQAMLASTGSTELGVLCTYGTQCKSGYCAAASVDDKGVRCGNCVNPIALGMACDLKSSTPCARGSFCARMAPGTTGGTCKAYLGEGNACDDETALCGGGLYCSKASKTCLKQRSAGQPCAESEPSPCAGALVCSAGKCAVRLAAGAPCTRETGECDALLRCAAGVCTAPPQAKLGELCEGTGCAPDAACKVQTCVLRVAIGAKCAMDRDVCVRGAACLDGVCQVPDPGICK
ncbi:MAG: hypothetical protein U0174_24785 [Polyangiaceae bacterium]